MSLKLSKYTIGESLPYGVSEVLQGEVKGTSLYFHKMKQNEKYVLTPFSNSISIFFLIKGNVTFISENKEYRYDEKAIFVNSPDKQVEIISQDYSEVLEIKWPLLNQLDLDKFPFTQKYVNATQYRDACKSDKSISRMLIDWSMIPGFAMGSVETEGYDIVCKHSHPTKDQIFFSFEESNFLLLINDSEYSYEANCFVHIPLASDHGIKVENSNKAHYLWMDFDVLGEIER